VFIGQEGSQRRKLHLYEERKINFEMEHYFSLELEILKIVKKCLFYFR